MFYGSYVEFGGGGGVKMFFFQKKIKYSSFTLCVHLKKLI